MASFDHLALRQFWASAQSADGLVWMTKLYNFGQLPLAISLQISSLNLSYICKSSFSSQGQFALVRLATTSGSHCEREDLACVMPDIRLLVGLKSRNFDRAVLDLLEKLSLPCSLGCRHCWQYVSLIPLHVNTCNVPPASLYSTLVACDHQIKLPQESCIQQPRVLRCS